MTEPCHLFHLIDPHPADGYLALTLEMKEVFPGHWLGRCPQTNAAAQADSKDALRQALQADLLEQMRAAQQTGNLPAALEKLEIPFHQLNPNQTPPPELNQGRFIILDSREQPARFPLSQAASPPTFPNPSPQRLSPPQPTSETTTNTTRAAGRQTSAPTPKKQSRPARFPLRREANRTTP